MCVCLLSDKYEFIIEYMHVEVNASMCVNITHECVTERERERGRVFVHEKV